MSKLVPRMLCDSTPLGIFCVFGFSVWRHTGGVKSELKQINLRVLVPNPLPPVLLSFMHSIHALIHRLHNGHSLRARHRYSFVFWTSKH